MLHCTPELSSQSVCPDQRPHPVSHLIEEHVMNKGNIDRRGQRIFRQRTRKHIAELEERLATVIDAATRREVELVAEVHASHRRCQMLEQYLDNIIDAASESRPEDTVNGDARTDPSHCHNSPHIQSELGLRDSRGLDSVVNETRPPAAGGTGPCNYRRNNNLGVHEPCPLSSKRIGVETPVRLADSYPSSSLNRRPSVAVLERSSAVPTSAPRSNDLSSAVAIKFRDSGLPKLHMHSKSSGHFSSGGSRVQLSVSTALPQHLAPTCPLDRIWLDFLKSWREMLDQGIPIETVLGPRKAIMTGLVDPSLSPSVHPISRVLSEVLSTFPHVNLPEKMGMFYKIYLTMRWQISPTPENYALMPVWLRPTVAQIAVPHAAWIDNIPWPGIRDVLIEYPEKYPFEHFSEYYSQNVSVNWHFDDTDAVAHEDGNVVLHSIFEKHIQNLDNWTVQPEFERKFPEMSHIIFVRR